MSDRPRSRRLGIEVLEDRANPTALAIAGTFNATAVPAGDTVWFSSVAKVSGLGTGPASLHLTGGSVSFTAKGTAYTVAVPDTTVNFAAGATKATTAYSADGGWVVTVPLKFTGNVFAGGAGLPDPGGLPGGVKGVTWRTDITADVPGLKVSWKWAAAAYSSFGALGGVGAKAVDDGKVDAYTNSDKAGTPEAFKAFVVGGAMGSGGSNYTGNYTGAKSVAADRWVPPPPAGSATLSGRVVLDADGGQEIDDNDFGWAGVQVNLRDASGVVVQSVYTAEDGTYRFDNVAVGTYSVEVVVVDQVYVIMGPQVGTSGGAIDQSWTAVTGIQLDAGEAVTGVNFGAWESAN